MSKTITVPVHLPGRRHAGTLRLDVAAFAQTVTSPDFDAPVDWLRAGLVAHVAGSESLALTPRGKDLLASIDSIPDDPVPEQPKATPCQACGGTGERPLFVSMETCDACGGSGQEQSKALRVKDARLTINGVGVGPYNADDYYAQVNGLGKYHIRVNGHVISYDSDAPNKVYSDGWWLDGLPEVGRHVEVKVRSGEVLRGLVTAASLAELQMLRIEGSESRPHAQQRAHLNHWITWASSYSADCVRVGWRYVAAPKLDAPDDSR